MFVVDQDFKVTFFYYAHKDPMPVGENAWASHTTECEIRYLPDGWSVVGIADCSVNDDYDEQTGEELALERALRQLEIDDELVTMFWDEYYE